MGLALDRRECGRAGAPLWAARLSASVPPQQLVQVRKDLACESVLWPVQEGVYVLCRVCVPRECRPGRPGDDRTQETASQGSEDHAEKGVQPRSGGLRSAQVCPDMAAVPGVWPCCFLALPVLVGFSLPPAGGAAERWVLSCSVTVLEAQGGVALGQRTQPGTTAVPGVSGGLRDSTFSMSWRQPCASTEPVSVHGVPGQHRVPAPTFDFLVAESFHGSADLRGASFLRP